MATTETFLSQITTATIVNATSNFVGVQGTTDLLFPETLLAAAILSAPVITGHATIEGVTLTGATGTGKIVFDHTPTISSAVLNTATLNNATLNTATLSNSTLNTATINNATINNATLNTATINTATFNNATLNTATINSSVINNSTLNTATIASSTLNTATINNSTINTATINTSTLLTPTITGHATIEGVTLTGVTGTGSLVLDHSPTLILPNVGSATANSINKVTITQPAATATLTIANAKSLTVNNIVTLAASADSQSWTFPTTGGNVLTVNNNDTITKGYYLSPFSVGTMTATFTPDAANGNYQFATHGGTALVWNVPAQDSAIDVWLTNAASSAGAITFTSSFKVGTNIGDAYATTASNQYIVSIRRIGGTSTYVIKALQ